MNSRISWKKTQKGNPKKYPVQIAEKQAEIKKTGCVVNRNRKWRIEDI
jgi:hypothetical protein